MIIKNFELNKIDVKKFDYYLLYGENEGHKNEIIKKKFKINYSTNIYTYEENEILKNKDIFFNTILTKSFFEDEKLVIISRITDKSADLIDEIIQKKITDLTVILNAGILEKKSKLRNLFERSKITICIPFYTDNNQTLMFLINTFFKNQKIPISQQAMNIIMERCRGDRQNLENELQKIKSFMTNKNKIQLQDLLKLTNLAENYDVSDLIDSCLSKNKKRTINILNENNYSLDDCIIIIRTFLVKSKRLLRLFHQMRDKKNIEEVVSSFKPPIFWKDKEIVKKQLSSWNFKNMENLIFKINKTELLIKKNSSNSINILSNFIMEQTNSASN
tara:strand:- start:901 stop:1896 length:996 start_codon:yes stop_codon:yes gene_type:complete